MSAPAGLDPRESASEKRNRSARQFPKVPQLPPVFPNLPLTVPALLAAPNGSGDKLGVDFTVDVFLKVKNFKLLCATIPDSID